MAAAIYLKGFYTFCLLIRFAAVCVLRKEEGGHILGNGFLGMKAESSCCDDMIYFLLLFFYFCWYHKKKVTMFLVLVWTETSFNHSSDLPLHLPSILHSRVFHQITVNIHSRTIHLFLLTRWRMVSCLRSIREPQSAFLSFLSNQTPKTCLPRHTHTHTNWVLWFVHLIVLSVRLDVREKESITGSIWPCN